MNRCADIVKSCQYPDLSIALLTVFSNLSLHGIFTISSVFYHTHHMHHTTLHTPHLPTLSNIITEEVRGVIDTSVIVQILVTLLSSINPRIVIYSLATISNICFEGILSELRMQHEGLRMHFDVE
jgi:hypothetical protein